MADGLRLLAPLLLAAYLGVTFVWRSYRVWRRTGVNPYVLSREDYLEGVIARFFRLSVLLLIAAVGVATASFVSDDPWTVVGAVAGVCLIAV